MISFHGVDLIAVMPAPFFKPGMYLVIGSSKLTLPWRRSASTGMSLEMLPTRYMVFSSMDFVPSPDWVGGVK